VNVVWGLGGFFQGLVGGIVCLVVLAIRAAIDGRPGVTFADLWTALAVGIAVAIVPAAIGRIIEWRVRRALGPVQGTWSSFAGAARTPVHPTVEGPSSGSGGMDRFDKFTDGARRVLTLSQDEAQRLGHNCIGTEHLLLGLVREGDGLAARALENLGADLAKVRTAVEFIIGQGDHAVSGEVGLTPRAKRVIELAIAESRTSDAHEIGTEHLLLGLVREGEGIGAGVLESFGITLDQARAEVIRLKGAGDSPA
jgi:hypothetical protein